nr:MurR/RpiR family transcriptional regulator [Enterococcus cecorum]
MLLSEKMKQVKLSPAEQNIIQFMQEHPFDLDQYTISQLANQLYVHPSTFIRLAKKLEFDGWLSLRQAFKEEQQYLNARFQQIDPNLPFSANDNEMLIASNIAQLESATLTDSFELLTPQKLKTAKKLLKNAKQIKIFGSSGNLMVAKDFMLKMQRLNCPVEMSDVIGESLYQAYNTDENTCAILISYTGENEIILSLAKMLKKRHTPIIVLTSIGENQLSQYSDCTLHLTTRERLYSKIASYTINTSISYLLDVLYSLYFSLNYQENFEHIIEMGKMIDIRHSSSSIMQENFYD